MTTVATATVQAGRLQARDSIAYAGTHVEVSTVSPLGYGSAGHVEMVEVMGFDSFGGQRWIDYGATEMVTVVSGPSLEAFVPRPVAAPVVSPTQRAREAVRAGKVRSLPSSAALVLYAVAAAEEEAGAGFAPSIGSIATGAGLAISTTQGHLRALAAKGLVRQSGTSYTVAAG